MKILKNSQYDFLLGKISEQRQVIKAQSNYIKRLEHDINLLKNINSPVDVIFPNTDERGLNSVDTASMYPKTKNDFLEL